MSHMLRAMTAMAMTKTPCVMEMLVTEAAIAFSAIGVLAFESVAFKATILGGATAFAASAASTVRTHIVVTANAEKRE